MVIGFNVEGIWNKMLLMTPIYNQKRISMSRRSSNFEVEILSTLYLTSRSRLKSHFYLMYFIGVWQVTFASNSSSGSHSGSTSSGCATLTAESYVCSWTVLIYLIFKLILFSFFNLLMTPKNSYKNNKNKKMWFITGDIKKDHLGALWLLTNIK